MKFKNLLNKSKPLFKSRSKAKPINLKCHPLITRPIRIKSKKTNYRMHF